MALETIYDNLRRGYNQLQPGTFLHADQLMAKQLNEVISCNTTFYVADGPLYSLEGKEKTPTLWLTREPDNLVLRHLNDKVGNSYDQLVKTRNFHPPPEEARQAMEAKGTLCIDLTKLRLYYKDEESSCLEISTTDFDVLNTEEQKLAERFYEQGDNFIKAMEKLDETGIGSAIVGVLSPDYVSREAAEGPIGRAAWRYYFGNGSSVLSSAVFFGIGNDSELWGVRKKSSNDLISAQESDSSSDSLRGVVAVKLP